MVKRTGFRYQGLGVTVRVAALLLSAFCLLPAIVRGQATPMDIQPAYMGNGGSVLDATTMPGSDIGAKINAAFAAGPSSGSHVIVPAGSYSYSTPIVLSGKSFKLECSDGSTVMTFTPSSGVGITVDGAYSLVSGCKFVGSGGSSSGMLIGGSAPTEFTRIENNEIMGFGTGCGLTFGNNAFLLNVDTDFIYDNGTGGATGGTADHNVCLPSGLTGTGENIAFTHGAIYSFQSGYSASCVNILLGNMSPLTFENVSFDQCGVTLNGASSSASFLSSHFENPGASTTLDFLTIGSGCTSCAVNLYGVTMIEDTTSSRTEFISVNGTGYFISQGGAFSAAQTTAQLIKGVGGNAVIQVIHPQLKNFTAAVGGSYYGATSWVPGNLNISDLVTVPKLVTGTNCAANSVSPAACGGAASGVVVVPTTTTSYTVNTTQVSAGSRIILQAVTDNTGIPSSPTCVVPATTSVPVVSARSAGVSFTITLPSTSGATCWNFWLED